MKYDIMKYEVYLILYNHESNKKLKWFVGEFDFLDDAKFFSEACLYAKRCDEYEIIEKVLNSITI